MAAELGFNTIDRMAAFLQNADDAQMPVQEKLALAVSGWLLGSDSAIDQLPVALSIIHPSPQIAGISERARKNQARSDSRRISNPRRERRRV